MTGSLVIVAALGLLPPQILVTAPAQEPRAFQDARGSFEFDGDGEAPAVRVWYYRPARLSAKSHVLILMHGSSRTGQEGRDIGATFAEDHDFVLLVPEFREKDYPGDRYAFGNMVDTEGRVQAKTKWGFSLVERLFDHVRQMLALSATTYDLVGHSAGGQFVQRLVLFLPSARFRRAVASSPGRYAFPSLRLAFPYGLAGSGTDGKRLARAFSRDFVLVLGDRDTTDTEREPSAMLQGANRFARGLRFFAAATEEARASGSPLAWRLRIVRDADHTPGPMVRFALREVLE
jgi:pimeloyl-ACP methyl ester carboxylesterase